MSRGRSGFSRSPWTCSTPLFDAAVQHFETAVDLERRMGATPWVAHAQRGLAAALRARGAAGDGAHARTLLVETRATYSRLGIDGWATRAADSIGLSFR
jgi:hypothetical protein